MYGLLYFGNLVAAHVVVPAAVTVGACTPNAACCPCGPQCPPQCCVECPCDTAGACEAVGGHGVIPVAAVVANARDGDKDCCGGPCGGMACCKR